MLISPPPVMPRLRRKRRFARAPEKQHAVYRTRLESAAMSKTSQQSLFSQTGLSPPALRVAKEPLS